MSEMSEISEISELNVFSFYMGKVANVCIPEYDPDKPHLIYWPIQPSDIPVSVRETGGTGANNLTLRLSARIFELFLQSSRIQADPRHFDDASDQEKRELARKSDHIEREFSFLMETYFGELTRQFHDSKYAPFLTLRNYNDVVVARGEQNWELDLTMYRMNHVLQYERRRRIALSPRMGF